MQNIYYFGKVGGTIRAGSSAAPPTPPGPPVGQIDQITFAAHTRKVINTSSPGDSATFSIAPALAVNALTTQTVMGVPARGYTRQVRTSRPGRGKNRRILYKAGTLHSAYRGNEVDKIALPIGDDKVAVTTISHQPEAPGLGPNSGYAAGVSQYITGQSFAPEGYTGFTTQGAAVNWRPYRGHTWTMNLYHPRWGFSEILAHAVQTSYPSGSFVFDSSTPPVLQSSGSQPTDTYTSGTQQLGIVSWDEGNQKFVTYLSQLQLIYPFTDKAYGFGTSGLSNWCNWTQSFTAWNTQGGSTNMMEVGLVTGNVIRASNVAGTSLSMGGSDGHSGNGWVYLNYQLRQYLCMRQEIGGRAGISIQLYSEDFGSGQSRIINITSELPGSGPGEPFEGVGNASDPLSVCMDPNSRRFFWMVTPGPTTPNRWYWSTFDHPMVWFNFVPQTTNIWPDSNVWNTLDRGNILFFDGYIYFQDNATGTNDPGYQSGSINIKRFKVDSGEDMPEFEIIRYDYLIQNFVYNFDSAYQHWGNKHCNWLKSDVDGKWYFNAGDCGGSTSHCRSTLQFTGNAAGDYHFTQTADETSPAASGECRPASADDGYWFKVPMDSAWVAARGKFVWQRGGDGEDLFWNSHLRAYYGAVDQTGTPEQRAAAFADGWDISCKYYLFDPTLHAGNGGFIAKFDGTGWTQDNGPGTFPNPWTQNNAASRNGAFDPTTGCVWRFYNAGSPSMCCFDFVNQKTTFYNMATWTSPETGRLIYTSGAAPASPSDVIADGTKPAFCNLDTGSGRYIHPLALNWEHKATWLNPDDGKWYVVNPSTGYFWCVETRGTRTSDGDGYRIPFYPLGNRVKLIGTYPTLNNNVYPPVVITNADVRMGQFLLPFMGGLLWYGAVHHTNGSFGYPVYAFWRRLGFEGDWTVISFPDEFAANACAAASPYDKNNAELLLMSGGGNSIDTPGPWPFFWRMTA